MLTCLIPVKYRISRNQKAAIAGNIEPLLLPYSLTY